MVLRLSFAKIEVSRPKLIISSLPLLLSFHFVVLALPVASKILFQIPHFLNVNR
jgi:hypothetical protein